MQGICTGIGQKLVPASVNVFASLYKPIYLCIDVFASVYKLCIDVFTSVYKLCIDVHVFASVYKLCIDVFASVYKCVCLRGVQMHVICTLYIHVPCI